MKTYASELTRDPATPSVSSVIVESETADRSSAQSVLTFTSAMRSPDEAMYTHDASSVPVVGTMPAASVLAGSARMPAPTVVPATSAMAPASELVGGGGVKSPLGATALPAAGDSTDMRGGKRDSRLSDAGGSSGWCNSGASGDGRPVNVMLLTKNSGSMLLPLRLGATAGSAAATFATCRR